MGLYGGMVQWDNAEATSFMGQSTTVLLAQQAAVLCPPLHPSADAASMLAELGVPAVDLMPIGVMGAVGVPQAVPVDLKLNEFGEAVGAAGAGKKKKPRQTKAAGAKKKPRKARDDGLILSDDEDGEGSSRK